MTKPIPRLLDIRRRRHKRYGRNGSITLRRVISAPLHPGDLFDLSVGGCLAWMERVIAFEPEEAIEVRLHTDTLTFRVMGSVRYTGEGGRLVGVEFHNLHSKDAAGLQHFIKSLQSDADYEDSFVRC